MRVIVVPTPGVNATYVRILERSSQVVPFALGWVPTQDGLVLAEILRQGFQRVGAVIVEQERGSEIGVVCVGPPIVFWAIMEWLQHEGYVPVALQWNGERYYEITWQDVLAEISEVE